MSKLSKEQAAERKRLLTIYLGYVERDIENHPATAHPLSFDEWYVRNYEPNKAIYNAAPFVGTNRDVLESIAKRIPVGCELDMLTEAERKIAKILIVQRMMKGMHRGKDGSQQRP